MLTVIKSSKFSSWLDGLTNLYAKTKVIERIRRLSMGNFGDHKRIDRDLYELRIHCPGGYRVYFMLRDNKAAILLAGGDKRSQPDDIKRAVEIAKHWPGESV